MLQCINKFGGTENVTKTRPSDFDTNQLNQQQNAKRNNDALITHTNTLLKLIYSQASLVSKLVKQMANAWNADSGYR